MISSEDIRAAVAGYLHRHPDEAGRLAPLTAALHAPGDLTSRKTFTLRIEAVRRLFRLFKR
jgi:hypothetical protein